MTFSLVSCANNAWTVISKATPANGQGGRSLISFCLQTTRESQAPNYFWLEALVRAKLAWNHGTFPRTAPYYPVKASEFSTASLRRKQEGELPWTESPVSPQSSWSWRYPPRILAMYTFYRVRKLRTEERLAAIQRGVTVPMEPELTQSGHSRRAGILLVAGSSRIHAGVHIVARYEPDAMRPVVRRHPLHFGPGLLPGFGVDPSRRQNISSSDQRGRNVDMDDAGPHFARICEK